MIIMRLGVLRANRGLSQSQLSKVSGLSRHAIQELEDDNIVPNPKLQTLIKLARALEVEVAELYEIVD
jgi:transcriptional regulator with XRE-family HTH domain